ncbi:MAG: hypothetical protein WKG00_37070 [Polyangiaceae bacterium]
MLDKILGKLGGVKQSLKMVASDGSERLDILRMGVESAWAELKTAVQTAAGPIDPPKVTDTGSSQSAAANDGASQRAA